MKQSRRSQPPLILFTSQLHYLYSVILPQLISPSVSKVTWLTSDPLPPPEPPPTVKRKRAGPPEAPVRHQQARRCKKQFHDVSIDPMVCNCLRLTSCTRSLFWTTQTPLKSPQSLHSSLDITTQNRIQQESITTLHHPRAPLLAIPTPLHQPHTILH